MYKHLNISITSVARKRPPSVRSPSMTLSALRMLLVAWRRSSLKDTEKGRLISISRTTQCPSRGTAQRQKRSEGEEMIKMPVMVEVWSVDSLAECLDAVGPELYRKLWSFVPAEGESPKGKDIWHLLSEDEQRELVDAVHIEFPDDED